MATFSTAGYYSLQDYDQDGNFTIANSWNDFDAFFEDADGVLSPGDPLDPSFGDGYSYVGSFQGDLIITDGFNHFLFTEGTPAYPLGTPGTTDTSSPFVFCFATGTAIATPGGAVAVEELAPGDLVLTADRRSVPVTWIGRQTLVTFFLPEARSLVRIAAGALGEGMPSRELCLTGDHALLLDGVLVNAGAIVNGTTIARIPRVELPARFTVFHVETADHDIILAEGVPAETFMDAKGRERFDNHADYVPPPGGARKIEHPAARVTAPRQVPARLLARIAAEVPDGRKAAA